jgi:Tfp pilus assembly protein PilO
MSYKNLLWLAGPAVAIILLWVFAVYIPISAQAKKGQSSLNSVLQERKALETSILTMTQQVQSQETLKKSYDEFLTRAPAVGRMGEYMTGVVQAAKLRGMSLDRLSGQYDTMEVSNKNIVHPVFEMGLKGRFLDMGRFLEELSGQTAYGSIKQAMIVYDEKDYPVLSGRFVIEFKALKERTREGK